jgi:hypothetical protein
MSKIYVGFNHEIAEDKVIQSIVGYNGLFFTSINDLIDSNEEFRSIAVLEVVDFGNIEVIYFK